MRMMVGFQEHPSKKKATIMCFSNKTKNTGGGDGGKANDNKESSRCDQRGSQIISS